MGGQMWIFHLCIWFAGNLILFEYDVGRTGVTQTIHDYLPLIPMQYRLQLVDAAYNKRGAYHGKLW
ncbi:hypothetical protein SAMN05216233_103191 [Desulfoluna spongiiphila]|uniref:Uncharacterized protein n=1 Tax=Desulfoluna spongiiphila TaxID=419481 RepID=A0A1G5CT67_9BACT|nr:hypothetical protein SAMN05216233_103191 [Desulfoluna spongiiphila]